MAHRAGQPTTHTRDKQRERERERERIWQCSPFEKKEGSNGCVMSILRYMYMIQSAQPMNDRWINMYSNLGVLFCRPQRCMTII